MLWLFLRWESSKWNFLLAQIRQKVYLEKERTIYLLKWLSREWVADISFETSTFLQKGGQKGIKVERWIPPKIQSKPDHLDKF